MPGQELDKSWTRLLRGFCAHPAGRDISFCGNANAKPLRGLRQALAHTANAQSSPVMRKRARSRSLDKPTIAVEGSVKATQGERRFTCYSIHVRHSSTTGAKAAILSLLYYSLFVCSRCSRSYFDACQPPCGFPYP
jgi:hypothetical protein